jgi:hypothetical protein
VAAGSPSAHHHDARGIQLDRVTAMAAGYTAELGEVDMGGGLGLWSSNVVLPHTRWGHAPAAVPPATHHCGHQQ